MRRPRTSENSPSGERESQTQSVDATDPASIDADSNNGKRRLPCHGMRRPDVCRRGALVARETREEAKSVEQSARLGRISFFGSSRLGNGADLLHQVKLVLDGPRLGDLAFLYAVDGYPREFDSIASRGDVHVVPLVGGAAPPMSNHFIPLGYYVVDGAYHIRG